jgi:hypothetical protein
LPRTDVHAFPRVEALESVDGAPTRSAFIV